MVAKFRSVLIEPLMADTIMRRIRVYTYTERLEDSDIDSARVGAHAKKRCSRRLNLKNKLAVFIFVLFLVLGLFLVRKKAESTANLQTAPFIFVVAHTFRRLSCFQVLLGGWGLHPGTPSLPRPLGN